MNVLFLTLLDFYSIKDRNIYTDLLREFVKNGHKIYAVSPVERRNKRNTSLIQESDCTILKLKIGNTQKTNAVEKGISTVCMERQYIRGIRKYFRKVRFDLVLYSTPPITLCKAIAYVKKRDGARSYLLLKDIFPQNAVDMGMLEKKGIKGILYWYFRAKEKKLYEISDMIGCMSQANVNYVLRHNPKVRQRNQEAKKYSGRGIVEICPNSIEPIDLSLKVEEKYEIRKQYGLPQDKMVFVYGGNLGKPQGIDFLLKCVHEQKKNKNILFLIVGNGTEYCKIQKYMETYNPANLLLYPELTREDYEKLAAACDVGMIFLDRKFTIPNFPSRILTYMQAKLPVLAVTDVNTDVGKVIVDHGFGWWCESGDIAAFDRIVKNIISTNNEEFGRKAYLCLKDQYNSKNCYDRIDSSMKDKCSKSKYKKIKNIIFIGNLVDKEEYHLVSKLAIPGVNMQRRIIEELEKQEDLKIHVISIIPIEAYPDCKQKKVKGKPIHITEKTKGIQVPFENIRVYRQLRQYIEVERYLQAYLKSLDNPVILLYNMYINISIPALKQKRNGVKIYSILADLPIEGDRYKKGINKILMEVYIHLTKINIGKCDGLIVLNKHASKKYAPEVPYIVMEGGFDVEENDDIIPYRERKKDIVYTGALFEYNGILNLIDSMQYIKKADVRLKIYGNGDLFKVIEEKAKNIENIDFYGYLDHNLLREVQKSAYILVNARNIKDEVDQICFPSKLFEYLSSGTVVLSTELSGLEEYFPYLYHIPSNNPEQLALKLLEILETSSDELECMAEKAKKFISEQKSWEKQVNKIYDFINGR